MSVSTGTDPGDRDRRETEHKHRQRSRHPHHRVIDGVNPHGGQPIEINGRVVDGMKPPQAPPVKGAMHPITDEIADRQNADGLYPERQP